MREKWREAKLSLQSGKLGQARWQPIEYDQSGIDRPNYKQNYICPPFLKVYNIK